MSQALTHNNKFRAVVRDIIQNNGFESVDEMEAGEFIQIDSEVFMPVTVQKHTTDTLLVQQTYTQRGDTMRDPQVMIDISDEAWKVIEFIQDGGMPVNQYNPDGLDLGGFLSTWGKNLRAQGFVEV